MNKLIFCPKFIYIWLINGGSWELDLFICVFFVNRGREKKREEEKRREEKRREEKRREEKRREEKRREEKRREEKRREKKKNKGESKGRGE